MRTRKLGFSLLITLLLMVGLVMQAALCAPTAWAEEEKKKDLPPHAISLALEYTGVIVPKGEDVSVDLKVINGGRSDEDIDVVLTSVPDGWKGRIKTYSFMVSGVHLESDSSKNLTFKAEPDKSVGPGEYSFAIKATTREGNLSASTSMTVTVIEEKKEQKERGVIMTTSYPVLQGPSDAKFEFSLEVENKLEKDTIYNLTAEGPKDWEIRFKPSYEDKYFSSLRIKANQSQTLAVEVKPFPFAQAGEFPIKVKVKGEKAEAEADLVVILTGTYKMDVGTATGLLSLEAYQGKEANMSFYVKNSGTAVQNNIRFLSVKPENWKVEFKPEKIDTLAANDLKQVEVTVTPSEEALVGDYSVGLNVQGEKDSKNLELRVTVRASTAWGWVGIGIILLVIAGLVALFIRLGRR